MSGSNKAVVVVAIVFALVVDLAVLTVQAQERYRHLQAACGEGWQFHTQRCDAAG